MRRGKALGLLGVLALAGCAEETLAWAPGGHTQDEWLRDHDACVEESRTEVKVPVVYWVLGSVMFPIGLPAMALGFRRDAQKFADEKMKACLTSRGYQQVQP